MLLRKIANFQYTRRDISVCRSLSAQIFIYVKIFFFFFFFFKCVLWKRKKREKKTIPGRMLGQDRPEKRSAKNLIRHGEIPSPRQTSTDKANDCVMKSDWGALVRGSDPPSDHMFTTRPVICDGRRRYEKHLVAGV